MPATTSLMGVVDVALDDRPMPTLHAHIEGAACEYVWKVLRAEVAKRQRDGGQVRPAVQRAMDELRRVMQEHLTLQAMFARANTSLGPVTNIAAESLVMPLLSTKELAGRLNVTPTHARRLAAKAGIEPITRNAWRPTDVDELVTQRRTA